MICLIAAVFFIACDKNNTPHSEQQGDVGVYCVLEPDRAYNQQVILRRLSLPGEPEVYTPAANAQVSISAGDEVYELYETASPGVYRANFQPQLGQQYTLNIITAKGEHITSTMKIPEAMEVKRSSSVHFPASWHGPLHNALYPGIVISADNANEEYYVLIKGHPNYDGYPADDTLKYWSTNHTGADPLTKVELGFIESGLASYQDNAFSYPMDDPSMKMSFYKDFLLIKNPHKFNSNRLLGINYQYNKDGDEYWDNGFVITAGPFARFSKYAKGPLQDMSPEAVAAFGRDFCETYSLCLTFVQMTTEYVEYFKNTPGFPEVQNDQIYLFKKDCSNINGGVGIFTSKVTTYNLIPYFVYTNDIHNKEFREYYLSSRQFEYNTQRSE